MMRGIAWKAISASSHLSIQAHTDESWYSFRHAPRRTYEAMMIGPLLALLLSSPTLGAVLPAQQERQHPARPGMVYDAVTDRYVPIIGWRPSPSPTLPIPAGTRFQPNRLGQKLGEAPIGH
jgi:hypothetical protein